MTRIKELRKNGIAGRDALSLEDRMAYSHKIVESIIANDIYKNAKTVMLYKGIRGEVRLDALEQDSSAREKTLVYPLCIGEGIMIALNPLSQDSWIKGSFGISEPVREKSLEISPEEIDLIICPCSVFDEHCNRIGMGGGYYDRFLGKCINARIISVAFEAQKAEEIPLQPWDLPMEMTFTEDAIYVSDRQPV